MTRPIFLYGTLLDPELYEIVSGAPFEPHPARLPGTTAHVVDGADFPILITAPDRSTEGAVVYPDDRNRARLDFYELGFGYGVVTREVETREGPVTADIYFPETDWPLGHPWSLAD